MTYKDISIFRLFSQQVASTDFKSAKDIVRWMGAMQAQDYNMAKWAIGVRLPGSTEKSIEAALDKGDIIRTHLLRPTWHFVSARDIYWMLELTAPRIKASLKSRHKELELEDTTFKKSNKVIEKALSAGKHLNREELISRLENAKIVTGDQRSAHLILVAELDGIICSGATKENKQTYALLPERVPNAKTLNRDEALGELALRYFTSHSPATVQDFVWWSGLTVADAKNALEMIKPNFISEKIDSQTYWFFNSFSLPKVKKGLLYLLPAFDEFIISYKDRKPSLSFENHNTTISSNGIFRPVIVVDGQVVGIWKRTIKKDKAIIETQFFQPPTKSTKSLIEKTSEGFGYFLNRRIEIDFGLK